MRSSNSLPGDTEDRYSMQGQNFKDSLFLFYFFLWYKFPWKKILFSNYTNTVNNMIMIQGHLCNMKKLQDTKTHGFFSLKKNPRDKNSVNWREMIRYVSCVIRFQWFCTWQMCKHTDDFNVIIISPIGHYIHVCLSVCPYLCLIAGLRRYYWIHLMKKRRWVLVHVEKYQGSIYTYILIIESLCFRTK